MYNVRCTVFLVACWGVGVNSPPVWYTCSVNQIDLIKDKHAKKVWDEIEKFGKINELIIEVSSTVNSKIRDLEEMLGYVTQFAEENLFEIDKCLGFDYINSAILEVEQSLRKFTDLIRTGSLNLLEYVQSVMFLLDDCGNLQAHCTVIERCCRKVVQKIFDDGAVANDFQKLEVIAKRYLDSVLSGIDKDIVYVQKTTNLCNLKREEAIKKAAEAYEAKLMNE